MVNSKPISQSKPETCASNVFLNEFNREEKCYSEFSQVLSCFIQHNDNVFKYVPWPSVENNEHDITIKNYTLFSQQWPVYEYKDIPTTIWQHRMVFYIPQKVSYSQVLLYINGGSNRDRFGEIEFSPLKESINYKKLAEANDAIVVELNDVPNQFLFFAGEAKKEDEIIARTFKMFLENPIENAYLAGHLPMAKAIVKAMDAAQNILKDDYDLNITGFILSGASKRGWAVWLAALEDERVDAIIPIVIDILNIQKSIPHICSFYQDGCPAAFKDYIKEGIIDQVNTDAFAHLVKVEDPFSYLGKEYNPKYKDRLSIPKYIISASGDDFFTPDSSKWYLTQLPGANNHIRYLANAMHYFAGNPISDSTNSLSSVNTAIDSYFYFILHNTSLPKTSWNFGAHSAEVTTSLHPQIVKLWTALNEESRDFRFLNSYSFWHLLPKKFLLYSSHCLLLKNFMTNDICDNCYHEMLLQPVCSDNSSCYIQIELIAPARGWKAEFIELTYEIDNHFFTITTEVQITPDMV